MNTIKTEFSYSKDFIRSYKNLVSSYINIDKEIRTNSESLPTEQLDKLLDGRFAYLMILLR